MSRPLLLDLFCGAGGAAMGYHRAGFCVIGVDINYQKNYPFKFILGDALETAESIGAYFDAIHASPPCQKHSAIAVATGASEKYDDYIPETRRILEGLGLPYTIENVERSPLNNPVILCGTMFGLRTFRHRLFECTFDVPSPPNCEHRGYRMPASYSGYHRLSEQPFISCVGHSFSARDGKIALGIDWEMTRDEIAEAIPPAYTEYIGRAMMAHIKKEQE